LWLRPTESSIQGLFYEKIALLYQHSNTIGKNGRHADILIK
jgi:hypothetical protein